VDLEPKNDPFPPDLVVSKGNWRYAVELKALKEGRADRVVALLSQAILQAGRQAEHAGMAPLAVIQVAQASPALERKVRQFHRTRYSTDGRILMWEYPHDTPNGEQMDFVEVMEIENGKIRKHRVYWGWVGFNVLKNDQYRH